MIPPADSMYIIGPGPLPQISAAEAGNKAWNLMRMAAAGLRVPAGFVLPTKWTEWIKTDLESGGELRRALQGGIQTLEKLTSLSFGSPWRPLLVSVRSGAAVSMPGMMETILNIGLNASSVQGLIRQTGNPRQAWDCYRRLIQSYGEVVCGLPAGPFEQAVARAVTKAGEANDRRLDFRTLKTLSQELTDLFEDLTRTRFPADPYEQLEQAARAVIRSWDAPKAVAYRRLHHMDDAGGTAVTVQLMVFGNAGGQSGSGVGFSRDPATGDRGLYLDFCLNGQGEDIVSGRRRTEEHEGRRAMLPGVWRDIEAAARSLETLFRDAQDFEFTVQNGTLYLLQARDAKRSDWAALRIAADLVKEGLIQPSEAVQRLGGIDLARVSRTRFRSVPTQPLARGEPASIGVASGAAAFDSAATQRMAKTGTPVILVRGETTTADISGIAAASGILTSLGSRTSHAAVVARQMGKVCLVGCAGLEIGADGRSCRLGGQTIREGDLLSLDGNQGTVYRGKLQIITQRPTRELKAIAHWRSQEQRGIGAARLRGRI